MISLSLLLFKKLFTYLHILWHIFSIFLCQVAFFQIEWILQKLYHVYKKGDPKMYCNYRPIFVLPCLSKILDRIYTIEYSISYISIFFFTVFFVQVSPRKWPLLMPLTNRITLSRKTISIGIFLDLSKSIRHHRSWYPYFKIISLWNKRYLLILVS